MVSSLLVDAIANPTEALQELYKDLKDNDPDAFFDRVFPHFSSIFSSPGALSEIPILDGQNPPHTHTDRSLVQFSAMIQDTSLSPEVYLAKLPNGQLGGWGLVDDAPGHNVDYSDLRECLVLWGVTIPGQLQEARDIDNEEHTPVQAHKYPIPGAKHVGVKIKVYDTQADSFRTTDLVTFVGILSSEPCLLYLVPALHVLFSQPYAPPPPPLTTKADPTLRDDMISWIANNGLAGDRVAAEWVLLSSLAKPLCLARFPPPPPEQSDCPPSLSRVLSLLFPFVTTIPLSLPTLNTTPFCPESKNEELHSGWLQLPKGSLCIVTESGVKEGTVTENGLLNLHRTQEMMSSQNLEYVFPFSKFTFETDVDFIITCEGSKSAFFQNNIILPLSSPAKPEDLYTPLADIPRPEKLDSFRQFAMKMKSSSVSISDEAAKYIQEDFVQERKDSGTGVTADDFIQRMTIARLLALSYGDTDITKHTWEKAKILDRERKQRPA
ncbi:hypothetical protein BDZ89DRAFT_1061703 [Hymenopellis radicata]|nr:hypothetical protein BDZ89DRAFT_1061703 [Hymenopellis radicata]